MSEFRSLLKKDKRLRRLREMCESGRFALDTVKLIEDLKNLHATRKMRSINTRAFLKDTQYNVTDISLQNSAFRSRASEIMMTVFQCKMELEQDMSAVKDWIQVKYNAALKSEYSTQESRKQAISYALSDFRKIADRFAIVIEISKMVIDDIDKGGFTVKAVNDAMALNLKGTS